jgi:hypothetical protein
LERFEVIVEAAGPYSVDKLTAEARRLAADYRRATGKTLPIGGEIAINDAVRILSLTTPDNTEVAWDAVLHSAGRELRVLIKGRVVFDERKRPHRIGQLKFDQAWDAVLLVFMDADYAPFEIYLAERPEIEAALRNKSRNKRGSMTVSQFKIISELVWEAPSEA